MYRITDHDTFYHLLSIAESARADIVIDFIDPTEGIPHSVPYFNADLATHERVLKYLNKLGGRRVAVVDFVDSDRDGRRVWELQRKFGNLVRIPVRFEP